MAKERPDIAALARKTVADAQEGSNVHPLRQIRKDENAARILLIPIAELEPNPDQPRKHFSETAHAELTASIRETGILSPLIARRHPTDPNRCILIAGERRLRAARAAGLETVPVLLRSAEDAAEVAIIENLQRENLSALEEAEALARLKEEKGYTDADLARIIGKSRSSVTESLSLTRLPDEIKNDVRDSMSNVRQWSKIQLLQVFRAGSPEKVRETWEALKRGEAPTVRALKERVENGSKGRPKHYTFSYKPDDSRFRLTLAFSKVRVTAQEVKDALREALKHSDE